MFIAASLPFGFLAIGFLAYRIKTETEKYRDVESLFIGLTAVIQSFHFFSAETILGFGVSASIGLGIFYFVIGALNLFLAYVLQYE